MTPVDAAAADLRRVFAEELAGSLRQSPPQIASKYFYDALGSALFEAICHLPWYRITVAESRLLARHAQDILDPLGRPLSIAELGCGNGEKLGLLAEHVGQRFESIQLVDISPAALDAAQKRLDAIDAGPLVPHVATYEEGIVRIAQHRTRTPMLVLFLGSNIGNFEPAPAQAMLERIHHALRPGDALLLGTDLVKPEAELLLAYDDPLQVTAAFNRNLLRRINDELAGDFVLERWTHRALWNGARSRVEMHLVSEIRQRVRIPGAGLDLTFEAGESIWTESSYKYQPEGVLALGRAAGFASGEQWIDQAAGFALTRFSV